MKVSFYQQRMKVWVVLAIWACWISMVELQSRCCMGMDATENEHMLKASYTVKFTTRGANRNSYLKFMKDLYNALTNRADRSGDIPVLPPQSAELSNPEQYLLVELSNGLQTVTLALNISNVYVLGYQPGGSGSNSISYFFSDVPTGARDALFPNTQRRQSLPFTGRYGSLIGAIAGANSRRDIPLGIDELRHIIDNMNYLQPSTSGTSPIARGLVVCIQMVSEAVRLRNVQQEILAVAEPRSDGTYGVFYPDPLLMEYQNSWEHISSAIQSATDGIFSTALRFSIDGQELVLSTLRQVLFIIAIMPATCRNTGTNNLQLLRMPTSISLSNFPMAMRSTGLKDNGDTCERALAPISHITGQNGMCVDVYQGSFHDGNKIILRECGQNQASQLWTLRTNDNTIRSGGKCLTTYGYSSGSYVMIYDCNTAVPDATKWEIRSDGSIRNPRSRLVLTGSKDSSGMINLVVDNNFYGSRQAWYASNNTKPPVTTIVGYNNLCLLASGSRVWLEKCVTNDAEQQWAIYPDGTIRPQNNRNGCLKYANAGGDLVTVETCDGWIEERWRFQSDGTILHVVTEQVMDVKNTDAILPVITVNDNSDQRPSQIWFQVQP